MGTPAPLLKSIDSMVTIGTGYDNRLDMNLRDLEYAVAVARLGHFGRAARCCGVSQPALSAQIRKLEDRLGVALFERTKRTVRTTPAGEEILPHARAILDLARRIEETARARSDPLSGPLRLGTIPTIGPWLTPRLLPSAAHGLPRCDLRLSEAITETLEQALEEGRLDAAITATAPARPRLAETALYEEPFWVALPRGHPLARDEDVDIHDIGDREFLLLADGHCLSAQVLRFCAEALRHRPAARTQYTSLATILALVGAGAGVTLVPATSLAGSWVTDSGIALRRERSGAARRTVRLVFRESFPRRAVLDKLADIVCAIAPDTVVPERR